MPTQPLYAGVNAAALTPLRDDLAPDIPRLVARCRHLLGAGCDGLGVLGTTGEATSFSVAERIAVMEGLVAAGIPPARLLPGTGCAALTDTVALTRAARTLGIPGVLVLPPFYYKNVPDDGLFAAYAALIEQTKGEVAIYLYNFPQMTGLPLSLPLIERLLRAFPGVVRGIKDSSGDFANMRAMIAAFGAEGFEVYSGSDEFLLAILREGGAGCITACANVASAASARVLGGFRAGDDLAAERAQAVLTAARRACTSVPLIAGLKALVARETGDEAWERLRPPLTPLGAADRARLFAAFDAAGLRELAAAA